MAEIKASIIDRLYQQYNGHATSFSGTYDGFTGYITVGFADSTFIAIPFEYHSLDGNNQGKMDVFMRVISQAAAQAIIQNAALHSDRQAFIDSVCSSGNILTSIIDALQSAFNNHRLLITGNYDGLQGTMHILFSTGETYNVNFSYIGDVTNSFIEICHRAIAYAISLYNVENPLSLYSMVTGDLPANQTVFTVDLAQQNLWATYTLYSEVYKDI
jgi:hypothetical protein